jgi:hypothetical protein
MTVRPEAIPGRGGCLKVSPGLRGESGPVLRAAGHKETAGCRKEPVQAAFKAPGEVGRRPENSDRLGGRLAESPLRLAEGAVSEPCRPVWA